MVVKYAAQSGVSLPEIMFWRQAGCLPVIFCSLALSGKLAQLRTQRITAHGGRAFVGMTNMVFNFGAAILLPLAESTTLSFTTPLFAVLIATVVLRDSIGPWRLTAVILGFAGIVIVAQPGTEPIPLLGGSMAIICAMLTAIINYQIRDLGRTEHPACSVFWFSAFGTVLMLPLMPFFMTQHSAWQWLLLASLGLLGAVAQLFMTASLRHGKVANVVVIDYTQLIWATAFGWLIWDKIPSRNTFLGAPLIIAAGMIIVWREHRKRHDIAISSSEND
jgi:drug/metabolite transporter (DMT)-like permease